MVQVEYHIIYMISFGCFYRSFSFILIINRTCFVGIGEKWNTDFCILPHWRFLSGTKHEREHIHKRFYTFDDIKMRKKNLITITHFHKNLNMKVTREHVFSMWCGYNFCSQAININHPRPFNLCGLCSFFFFLLFCAKLRFLAN